jgi:hypothetical protein
VTAVRSGTAAVRDLPGGLGLRALRHELPALLAFRLGVGEKRRTWTVPVAAFAVVAATVGLPLAMSAVAVSGADGVAELRETVYLVLPAAWSFFVVSTLAAAVGAAGGRELMPQAQAQVFPVSPATDHAGAVLLTPLNLAWSLQAAALFSAVGVVADTEWVYWIRLWLVTALWLVAATCLAQLVGWATELLRTLPSGSMAVRVVSLGMLLAAGWVVLSGRAGAVLDSLPTVEVLTVALGRPTLVDPWLALTVAFLLAIIALAFVGAVPLVAVLARRPPIAQARLETVPHRPVPESGGDGALLARLDRRLVGRSAPLRRGLAVLTALPVIAAALIPLPWSGIAVLPALIASAAGLLYGVNAFALDGPGAVWRDSLPHPPRQWLDARLVVLAQTCALCVVTVVATAGVRGGEPPNSTQATAVAGACLVGVVQVVSRCARWSVTRPYAVPLRGARDAPAPPVALAGYSVRLATATTLSGILFALASSAPTAAVPAVLVLPFLISGAWTLRRAAERFDDQSTRSRVITAVSGA